MDSNFNLLQYIAEGSIVVKIVLGILLLLSIYSLSIIFNKFRTINSSLRELRKIRHSVKGWSPKQSDVKLTSLFSGSHIERYKLFLGFLKEHEDNLVNQSTQVDEVLVSRAYSLLEDINLPLESRISALATIGTLSPFIGLLGTVLGIVNSFASIGLSSSVALNVIAPGISEALFSTAIGLFVAIPASFGFNLFTKRMQTLNTEQDLLIQDILFKLYLQKANMDSIENTRPTKVSGSVSSQMLKLRHAKNSGTKDKSL